MTRCTRASIWVPVSGQVLVDELFAQIALLCGMVVGAAATTGLRPAIGSAAAFDLDSRLHGDYFARARLPPASSRRIDRAMCEAGRPAATKVRVIADKTTRRFASCALFALVLAVPAVLAQNTATTPPVARPPARARPWPEDDALLARSVEAQQRRLFQNGPVLDFTLTSEFGLVNAERTPNNAKQFPGVLTVDGVDIPVTVGSRGHLRLSSRTCDFVPIKLAFVPAPPAGSIFERQTTLKLGTHCQNNADFDQLVIRESGLPARQPRDAVFVPGAAGARHLRRRQVEEADVDPSRALPRARERRGAAAARPRRAAAAPGVQRVRQGSADHDDAARIHARQHRLLDLDAAQRGDRAGQAAQVLSGAVRLRSVGNGQRAVCLAGSAAASAQRDRPALSRTLPHRRRVQRRRRTVPGAAAT